MDIPRKQGVRGHKKKKEKENLARPSEEPQCAEGSETTRPELEENEKSNGAEIEEDPAIDLENITFAQLGIKEQLCLACERLGWKAPTKIQQKCIGPALQDNDLIALAETGSGKTGAFALPILQVLMDRPQKLFALVLTPTRELAFQISEQFEALGSTIGLVVSTIVGGIDMATQAMSLGKRPHVIVATPGRLVDHLENTKGFSLTTLKYLVMDEADRILNMDFEVEVEKILRAVPKERRTYLFSATMTKKVSKLERACLKNPVRVELSTKYQTVDTLIQKLLFIPYKYKEAYLAHYLSGKSGSTVIVFCNTCAGTVKLALTLRQLGLGAVALHGQMSQPTRLGALNKFKKRDRPILVCTDLASRGLDIPRVDTVVNYDLPNQAKDYIHRVGRTARAGRAGNSLTVVTQYDVEQYQRIEQSIDKKLPVLEVNHNEVMQMVESVSEAARHAAKRYKEVEGSKGGKKRLKEPLEDEAPPRKHRKAEIEGIKKHSK